MVWPTTFHHLVPRLIHSKSPFGLIILKESRHEADPDAAGSVAKVVAECNAEPAVLRPRRKAEPDRANMWPVVPCPRPLRIAAPDAAAPCPILLSGQEKPLSNGAKMGVRGKRG